MALNLALAQAYAKLYLDMSAFNKDLPRVLTRLKAIPDIVVKVRLDTSSLNTQMRRVQQMGGGMMAGGGGGRGGSGPQVGDNVFMPASGRVPPLIPRPGRGGGGSAGGGILGFFGRARGAMGSLAGLPIADLALGGAAIKGARSAMDTEAAMARLRVVTGMTGEEASAMQGRLFDIGQRVPASMQAIQSGAATGARAGITDPEQLARFAEGLSKVGIALGGRIDIEGTAAELLRVMTLFGMAPDKIENVGSALVAMDNAANASAQEIFDFTQRLAPTGRQLGLSLQQVMALGTTMAESGINPEMGGSAMSRLLMKIAADPAAAAKAAGVSTEAMTASFRSNPIEALGLTMGGLNRASKAGNMEAIQFAKEDLGLANIRDLQTFLAMAPRMGRVAQLAGMGGEQMQSRQALESASTIMGQTTEASLTKFNNALTQVTASLGTAFLPMIQQSANALSSLMGSAPVRAIGDAFNAANKFSTTQKYLSLSGLEFDTGMPGNVTARARTPELQELEAARRAQEYRDAVAAQEAENATRVAQEQADRKAAGAARFGGLMDRFRMAGGNLQAAGQWAQTAMGRAGGMLGGLAPNNLIPKLFQATGLTGEIARNAPRISTLEQASASDMLAALGESDTKHVQEDQLKELKDIASNVKEMAKNAVGAGMALIGAE